MNGQICLLEKTLRKLGFVLIHDGQRNPGQFQLSPDEVKFFTRKYRLLIDDKFVNTWAIFKYDDRSQFADFEIVCREPEIWGKQKVLLEMEATDGTEKLVDQEDNRLPSQASYISH